MLDVLCMTHINYNNYIQCSVSPLLCYGFTSVGICLIFFYRVWSLLCTNYQLLADHKSYHLFSSS